MQPGYMDMHIPMPPLALGQPGAYQGYAQPYVPMAHMIPGTPAQQLYQMGSEITDSVAMQAQYSQYYQYGYGPLAPQVHPAPQAQPPSPQPQPSPKSQPSPPPSPPPPSDPPEN